MQTNKELTMSLVTTSDAARILGVSQNTILRLCQRGDLPAFKVGHLWRIDSTEFQAWLASQKNTSHQQFSEGQN